MDRNPAETARKIAEDALERLSAELHAGRSEALTNDLAAMSRFRDQSWANALLIAAQRPTATRVAGHHGWNDLGRAVKRGEQGIVIFAPAVGKPEYPFPSAGSRAIYVFDVGQTDGKPLPERTDEETAVWKYGEQLRALIAGRGIELQVDRSIEPARGLSSGGKIRLMPGLSPIQYLSTLAHELAHEMLHYRPEAATLSRDAIEAQAYGVAYVVARGLGIETDTPVAEYMAEGSSDKRALAQTLSVIQETSAQILDELLPEERVPFPPPRASLPLARLEEENFDRLYRDYGSRLVRNLTGFVRDRDRAEDIAAKAFQTAWEKRGGFRGDSRPSSWVEAIARNEMRNVLSRERINSFDSIDREEARELPAPGLVTDELEKRDDGLRLQQALVQVPLKQRRALTAHFVEGLSVREIARMERVPVGTVLSRIFNGKQLLREAWDASSPVRHDRQARATARAGHQPLNAEPDWCR